MSSSGACKATDALVEKLKKRGFAGLDDVGAAYDTAFILSDCADAGIAQAEERLGARIDSAFAAIRDQPRSTVIVRKVSELEVTDTDLLGWSGSWLRLG